MDILVRGEREETCLGLAAGAVSGAECLVDHNAVSGRGGNKGGAVRELGPGRVVVEGDI